MNNSNDASVSWRKRSNDLTGSGGKDDSKKNTRFVDNTSKITPFNEMPKTRERFNSDGDKGYQGYRQNSFQQPIDVKIDYSKLTVKYSTESKI